jgi:hypothetical protein
MGKKREKKKDFFRRGNRSDHGSIGERFANKKDREVKETIKVASE